MKITKLDNIGDDQSKKILDLEQQLLENYKEIQNLLKQNISAY